MEKLGKEDFIEFSIIDRRFLVSEERPFEPPKDSHLTTNVIRCCLWLIGLLVYFTFSSWFDSFVVLICLVG